MFRVAARDDDEPGAQFAHDKNSHDNVDLFLLSTNFDNSSRKQRKCKPLTAEVKKNCLKTHSVTAGLVTFYTTLRKGKEQQLLLSINVTAIHEQRTKLATRT